MQGIWQCICDREDVLLGSCGEHRALKLPNQSQRLMSYLRYDRVRGRECFASVPMESAKYTYNNSYSLALA